MAVPRLWVDLNAGDVDGGLVLDTVGSRRDLEEQGIELYEGLGLTVWTEDAFADDGTLLEVLEADAVIYWNRGWSARCDPNSFRVRSLKRHEPE